MIVYGVPAFEWNSDSGLVTLTLPACQYSFKWTRGGIGKQSTSLDGYTETDYLYTRHTISIEAQFISQTDFTAVHNFVKWAEQKKPFRFYPHYAYSQQRPPFMPRTFEDCVVVDGHEFEIVRSQGMSERWDFSIKCFTSTVMEV